MNGPGARTQRPFPEQNECCATCIIYDLILALVRNYSGGGERGQRPSLSALLLIRFCLLCSFRLHAAGDGQIVSRKQPRARISEADFRHHWRKHPHHNRTGYVPAWTFHRHQCIYGQAAANTFEDLSHSRRGRLITAIKAAFALLTCSRYCCPSSAVSKGRQKAARHLAQSGQKQWDQHPDDN